jgi:hypothetical protein
LAVPFSIAIFPLGGRFKYRAARVGVQTNAMFIRPLAVTRFLWRETRWAARPEIRRFGRRRRVASVPKCYRVRACSGFVDRSVKSSFERKINMSVSISNSSLTQAAAPTPSPAKAQPSEPSQHPAPAPGDSVKLSQAAQVHLFKQQGQSLSQIASNLGISAATVDGYLGIAVPKAPAAAPAVPTPSAPSPEPVDAHAPAQPTPAAGK